MDRDYRASPLNPLPLVVWVLVLPIVAMEIVLSLADQGLVGGATGVGWRIDALQRFGLSPVMLDRMVATAQYPGDWLMRFVTYPFVHLSFMHAAFVVVFILALGKMVGEVFSAWAVLVVFFASSIGAGIVYSLLPGVEVALVGGYPAAYGLIGAFTCILWARLGAMGANQYRAFSLIGLLLVVQLLFAALFGATPTWIADVIGFAIGFAVSFAVAPGGPQHILRRIRRR